GQASARAPEGFASEEKGCRERTSHPSRDPRAPPGGAWVMGLQWWSRTTDTQVQSLMLYRWANCAELTQQSRAGLADRVRCVGKDQGSRGPAIQTFWRLLNRRSSPWSSPRLRAVPGEVRVVFGGIRCNRIPYTFLK